MARRAGIWLALAVTLALGTWLGTALADRSATAPPIVYSGQVLGPSGAPIADSTTNSVSLSLYDGPDSGADTRLCPVVSSTTVATRGGHFSLPLSATCSNVFESAEEVWVHLVVNGTTIPGTRAGAVPYAVTAENGVPTGTIEAFAGETVPAGWLLADGRALNGADSRYADLYSVLGTAWGTGTNDTDATTNFNLPDLRGRFLRGLDSTAAPATPRDEDRGTRVASAPGGVTGNRVGTVEADQLVAHSHGYPWHFTGPGRNLVLPESSYAMGAGNWEVGSDFGGNETRPENAAVLYIVKL